MFIEIEKGTTVNLDQVTIVEERDGGKSLIYLNNKKSYASDIPYKTIVGLLKSDAKVASQPNQYEQFFGG